MNLQQSLFLGLYQNALLVKVVLLSEDTTEYNVIVERNLTNLPKIYLQQKLSASYVSLIFKSEDATSYDKLNIQSALVFGNLGRGHLKTPHTGPKEIYLRAQKLNLTTVVTNVNDMLPMLKKEMEENKKSVFFVLSDNDPDFNPSALITPYTITDSFVIYEWIFYQY